MACLNDFDKVKQNLKIAPFNIITKFHKLIFENEGNRKNRKNLREFRGFDFEANSEQYQSKIAFINTNFDINDLVLISNILCLRHNATKEQLVQNICATLMDLNSLRDANLGEEEEESDDSDDENDGQTHILSPNNRDNDQIEVLSQVSSNLSCVAAVAPVSFHDIENSVKPFDGGDDYPINSWIEEIEDTVSLFGLSDLHTFILAKKSLTGLAKLFVQGERGIRSWKSLKEALQKEFCSSLNSLHLHKMLTDRTLKKEESIQEYFLVMKEIAARGKIENEALIQYVINGIKDSENNKIVLYGATNIEEFKQKLKIYDEIKKKMQSKPTYNKEVVQNEVRLSKPDRCFNCGKLGHRSHVCRFKNNGTKCFNCNGYGHKAVECRRQQVEQRPSNPPTKAKMCDIISYLPAEKYKTIKINEIELKALIDTGSQINLMREDIFRLIGSPTLYYSDLEIFGLGKMNYKVIGKFSCEIRIDNETFLTNMFVAPNEILNTQIIIGNELLNQTELYINADEIKICKRKTDEIPVMNIEISDEIEPDIGPEISKNIRDEVKMLIDTYQPEKTKTTDIKMKINVKEEQPIHCCPRRLPYPEKEIVDLQVKQWIQEGVVEPCSSEYASQVVVTKKKCGSPRVCIDYRKINKIIIKDRYPLPLIEDQLDELQGAKIFSTIDLKNGFFHVSVEKNSRKYTSFVTHEGQYQFRKVPFGLCNSPAVFQRFINCAFKQLINEKIVLPYMDDLIIPAINEEEAKERLEKVLQTAKEYGLEINKRKCHFIKKSVEFLGYIIKDGKIFPSEAKTKAVLNFPEPTTLKQLQSFLGLTGYFRKFIQSYSKIAKPLSDMIKKDQKFHFDEEQRQAFEQLKRILAEKPVLNLYRRGAELELHTDASKDGYGSILLQKSFEDNCFHPIYYMSKKTSDAEKKYSSYELEVLAIVESLKKFRVYLLGTSFKIVTDCQAFQKTMDKKDLVTRIARWALLLEDYQYTIEHRAGVRMRHVDALSRQPVMIINTNGLLTRIKNMQREDNEIQMIKELISRGTYQDYMMKNGMIYKYEEGRENLVVPKTLQLEVIRMAHEKGHYAVKRTEEEIKKDFHIPNLKMKVEKCIARCVPCILINKKRGKQEGQLNPLNKTGLPLDTYHLDHLGPLESTNKNYKHILVVIDSFTKFVWLYPTKSTTAAEAIRRLQEQQKVFGNPRRIISDRGTAFTAKEFEDYCDLEKIEHITVTTGLPRANGQVERVNSTIISVLSKLSIDDPTKWYKYVDKLQRIINSTYHRAIDATPFELMIGVKMKNKEDLKIKKLIEDEIKKDFEEDREELREKAKKQIKKLQSENKKTYNLRRKDAKKYRINDVVAVKRTQFGPGLKLKPKYLGPYRIVKVKQNNTYDVEKEGYHDGPVRTTTCAEFIKPWVPYDDDCVSSEPEENQNGRM